MKTTAYESFEIAAKETEARYGKEKPMKQYLISDSLMEDLIKQGVTLSNEKKLLEAPEAQFLDLSKVERWDVEVYENEAIGPSVCKHPSKNGYFVRASDLTAAVQPDAKVLVEALECHAEYDWEGRPLNRDALALSAYRGWK